MYLNTIVGCILVTLMADAMADATVATSNVNHGNISNTLTTNATVTGLGSSYSAASASAGSFSGATTSYTLNTAPTTPGLTGQVSGDMHTYTNASAYNGSTGTGYGSASAIGHADADGSSSVSYAAPGQWLRMSGSDINTTGHSISASTNQSGSASTIGSGAYTVEGYVGSTTTTGIGTRDVTVYGGVSDTKSALAGAATGVLTVTGLPANVTLTNATMNATSNTVVDVSGSFGDPSH